MTVLWRFAEEHFAGKFQRRKKQQVKRRQKTCRLTLVFDMENLPCRNGRRIAFEILTKFDELG